MGESPGRRWVASARVMAGAVVCQTLASRTWRARRAAAKKPGTSPRAAKVSVSWRADRRAFSWAVRARRWGSRQRVRMVLKINPVIMAALARPRKRRKEGRQTSGVRSVAKPARLRWGASAGAGGAGEGALAGVAVSGSGGRSVPVTSMACGGVSAVL